VFGFSRSQKEQDLEDEFNRHGVVEKVVIINERGTKYSKGFGFVTMSSIEEATLAKEAIQEGGEDVFKYISGNSIRGIAQLIHIH
jgi:RNA recognition motif-containing protein